MVSLELSVIEVKVLMHKSAVKHMINSCYTRGSTVEHVNQLSSTCGSAEWNTT